MIQYLSRFLYVLPASKTSLILLLFAFTLVSALETLGIGIVGPFIVLTNNPNIIYESFWLNWAYVHSGVNSPNYFIALLGLLIIILYCVKSFLSWRVQTYIFKFSYKQQSLLSIKLLSAYLKAPYTFHLSKNSAYFIQSISDDTSKFANSVLSTFLNANANFFVMISLLFLLCITNTLITVLVLTMIFPLFLFFNSFKDKLVYWGKEVSQANEAVVRVINHSLGGIKETQLLNCGAHFETQLAEQSQRYINANSAFYAFKLSPRLIIETMLFICIIGFISVFLLFNQNSQQLIAALSVFALASIRAIPAISNFISGVSVLRNSSYILDKLYFDLEAIERSSVNKSSETKTTTRSTSRIRHITKFTDEDAIYLKDKIILDSVTYCYPNITEPALKEVSLTIHKGQSIALIGKSGAGKTTLVDVILGLLIPQQGDIKADNKSIYNNLRSWQDLIGYIPQSIFLVDDTIEKNIAFGVPDRLIDKQKLNKAIQAAQLVDLIERSPNGIQTMVGDRGVLLSGGQRQRIGIARALYHEREILILDEATSALDNETESLVTEAIKALSGTKTMIIIAHRLTTVEHCDRIYVMEKGHIVKSGSYQEVVIDNSSLSNNK